MIQTKRGTAKKPVATLTNLESHLGFWLRFVSNHVTERFQQEIERHGVSVSEWVAMRYLHDFNEAAPSGLMTALGMSKGAVSKIVSRLEEKGLASRNEDLSDKRAQSVQLTKAGRKLVPVLASIADQNDELFFGALSAEAKGHLMALMKELVKQHSLQQVPVH
jgi:DNA-binding MarR family transcriptional regulator